MVVVDKIKEELLLTSSVSFGEPYAACSSERSGRSHRAMAHLDLPAESVGG